MNKDIIYIDTEDDITAIIGRIKESKDKIIALVPPKRIGVLQSAVNLRLLARTAKNEKKHLVIITNNKALSALASMTKIPIAKNLQSKPEIPEIAALEVDDDVIDGAKLPVGELARTVQSSKNSQDEPKTIIKTHDYMSANSSDKTSSVEDVIDQIDVESDEEETLIQPSEPDNSAKLVKPNTKKSKKEKNKVKIPNFSRFRRRLFIAVILLAGFISFGVWAIKYAPAAVITISARTTDAPVSVTVELTDTTSVAKRTIQTIDKTFKKDVFVEFEATGSEIRGDKATGTITLTNSLNSDDIEVLAGTIFENGEFEFVTDETVIVPGAKFSGGQLSSSGVISVGMTAIEFGVEYNLAAGEFNSNVTDIAAIGSATTGGSKYTATIVTEEDITKATAILNEQSTTVIKNQLIEQFSSDELVIEDSFSIDYGTPESTPALDEEVTTTKARVSSSMIFTVSAVSKSDIMLYLENGINTQVETGEKVYDDGFSSIELSGYSENDVVAVINLDATGKIGPDIDVDKVKEQIIGKRFGDIQSMLSSIAGVNSVDTKFSYFWVNTVPSDLSKVTVEFKIDNE